ncbi:ABC-type multidrug transport system fused ATPase/permease subunit [Kineothrix alysoides]|uniref:ABC-type multidrug transport system fused ATPase/permease subunit n=1 Tax=Kineothrix alysoides TaxID=1469948 RepID=A0A4R1QM52_9FIRM|nr:ABC transporter ATP-binding protein [Kineothrix alysoides]TCL54799.1 ABC-type multidrug transport system fused ATPase/permease subunit [Kineothrix alysoides]
MKKNNVTVIHRREFTRQFYRHNKWSFIAAITASVLTALGNLVVSWLMQQIIDTASGDAGMFSLLQLAMILLVIVSGIVMVSVLEYYACPRFIKSAMRQYKDYAFEEMSKKNINAFTGENTSIYISALSNDATSIENNYLAQIFTLVRELLMFAGAFALMLYYSPFLTLVAFLLSFFPVIASVLTGNRLAMQEKEVSDRNESFIGMIKDMLSGFSVIKSFKAEREVFRLFAKGNSAAEEAKCRRRRTETVIQTIGLVAGIIAQFGVFLFGAYLALAGRGVTAGVVIVFVQLMNYVLTPIADVPRILANKKAAYALIDKLSAAVHSNIRKSGKEIEPVLTRGIELKSLSFSYEKDVPVLQGIDICFEAGKSYAIVGGSGSGKSTLLNLLMGSREDYEGEILLDSSELREIASASLYDIVSIVQQNVFVFNSTVKDNITMFRDFTEEELCNAVNMSGLAPFIAERGNDYACGENGSGLSGGERQRISIARCLLRGTPVMLVDEATAALDAKTAYAVSNSILDISGMTRIVVTHRLEEALLRKYDKILVFKNGRVEERGSFAELMEKKEFFYSLFTVSQ